MARGPGHPPKVTAIDERTMRAVRRAFIDIANEVGPRQRSRSATSGRSGSTRQPAPLELAVLAVKVARAMELVAAEYVERAREYDGATWEQVGEAFDISMQSAHARFRRPS